MFISFAGAAAGGMRRRLRLFLYPLYVLLSSSYLNLSDIMALLQAHNCHRITSFPKLLFLLH